MEPVTERLETSNSIFVIAPFWNTGTWVFDDPARGLTREPFVAGVPEVLSDLVAHIPDSRNGFKLLFSSRKFPGCDLVFNKVRSESGGTWYRASDNREGWLCPALFKYFPHAPKRIYARVEPLHDQDQAEDHRSKHDVNLDLRRIVQPDCRGAD